VDELCSKQEPDRGRACGAPHASCRLPGLPRLSLIIDFARAMNRLQAAIAEIEPRDSPAGLRDAGVEVIVGRGQFVDGPTIQAVGPLLRFPSAIVATGSEPGPPPVSGQE